MEIKDWRDKIDEIDSQILQLLNERARCSFAIGTIKKKNKMAVYCPEREKAILQRLAKETQGPLKEETVYRLFERIIDETRKLEKDFVKKETSEEK